MSATLATGLEVTELVVTELVVTLVAGTSGYLILNDPGQL